MKQMIETERLYFRELTPYDKEQLSKVLSNPESMQYYPHPFSEEEVAEWINWNTRRYREHQYGLWAVIVKPHDEIIGDCGIRYKMLRGGSFLRLDITL